MNSPVPKHNTTSSQEHFIISYIYIFPLVAACFNREQNISRCSVRYCPTNTAC